MARGGGGGAAAAAARAARDRPAAGAAAAVAAALFIALLDSLAKRAMGEGGRDLPVAMVLWGRYAGQLAVFSVLLLAVKRRRAAAALRTRRPALQLARPVVLAAETGLVFLALAFLPLTETIAVTFLSPLLVALLAVPLLGERIGPRRLGGIAAGTAGVLVILRPGGEMFHPAALAALGSAVLFALYQVLTRRLADTESPWTTLFYTSLVATAAASVPAALLWQTPTPGQALELLLLGALGTAAHGFLILAYSRAPAALVACFSYSELAFAAGMGLILFGALPDAAGAAGVALVSGSGIFVLLRERAAARAAARARLAGPPPPGAAPSSAPPPGAPGGASNAPPQAAPGAPPGPGAPS